MGQIAIERAPLAILVVAKFFKQPIVARTLKRFDCQGDVAMGTPDQEKLRGLLVRMKSLACEYYELTRKPLGVTGEVAELEAADKLGLELAVARTPFYDGFRQTGSTIKRFQIKGRAVALSDPYRGRVPSIKCDGEFDSVLLVLLDKATFEAIEIWEAPRKEIEQRLQAPGSRARNERGSMGIAQFKSIADRVWPTRVV